jgi:hypothetical protein
MLFTLITIITLLCFLFSLACLDKKKVGWWKYFSWFLLLTTLVEGVGYCLYFIFGIKNHILFNFFLPVEYIFLSWVIYKLSEPYFNSKPWILSGLTVILTIYLYESIKGHFLSYSTNSTIAASIYYTILTGLYFYFFMKKEKYETLKLFPPFWIIAGIFLFYFCGTAVNFYFDYLSSINAENPKALKLTRYKIYIILNFILYTNWAYAFICKYRQSILT